MLGLVTYFVIIAVIGKSWIQMFSPDFSIEQSEKSAKITVSGTASFSNVGKILGWIRNLPESCSQVVVNVENATVVDHNFLSKIKMENERSASRTVTIDGLSSPLKAVSPHPLGMRIRSEESI